MEVRCHGAIIREEENTIQVLLDSVVSQQRWLTDGLYMQPTYLYNFACTGYTYLNLYQVKYMLIIMRTMCTHNGMKYRE